MPWLEDTLDRLATGAPAGYEADAHPACEPAAWQAIALIGGGRTEAAATVCDWLVECQTRRGSVGVTKDERQPEWPTALATLAWNRWQRTTGEDRYQRAIDRAVKWTLDAKGRVMPRKPEIGHDTTLLGWSWAADTHAWLEPTAFFVRALDATGNSKHPRTREAVRLLVDRLLPTGGANYGNTRVLDQYLMPHVQPTGIVLWALATQSEDDLRIAASLDWLEEELTHPLGAASLAFGVLGLSSHGRTSPGWHDHLRASAATADVQASPYRQALLAVAAQSLPRS